MNSAPPDQRQHRNAYSEIGREKGEAMFSGDKGERQKPEGFHGPAVIPRRITGTLEKIAPATGLSRILPQRTSKR